MFRPTVVHMPHCSSRSKRYLVILISILNTFFLCVPLTTAWRILGLADGGDGLQICTVDTNIPTKESGAVERGLSFSLMVGLETDTCLYKINMT